MADIEWFFVDKGGNQNGPSTFNDLRSSYQSGRCDNDCLVWNSNMAGWEPIGSQTALLKSLQPQQSPQPSRMAPSGGPSGPSRVAMPGMGMAMGMSRPSGNNIGPAAVGGFANKSSVSNPGGMPAGGGPSGGFGQRPSGSVPGPQIPSRGGPSGGFMGGPPRGGPPRGAPPKAAPTHYWKELRTPEGQFYYYNAQSGVTTWEKPEELKTDADRERAGEWIWMPHPTEAFVPAKKMSENAQKIQCETEDGQTFMINKKEHPVVERLYWTQLRQLQRDLVMLDVMSRPLIMYNLRERFKKNEIYTNVGNILISINPYKWLPLYTPSILNEYINKGSKKLAPHVFLIADDAYALLRESNQSQSIVISGESGAGKTECTKQCLQYIAEIAGSSSNVEQRILLTNPILEAFGNAKTLRNNNSSRFGKYVEVYFDVRSTICGASNTNYLLEKSRVVFQTPMERSFHIFYQLCKGLSPQLKQKYRLRNCEDYLYLNQSGCIDIDGTNDVDDYNEVAKAMQQLNFSQAEIDSLFSLTAGVLQLGNINFQSTGDRKCAVKEQGPLQEAATTLQVDKTKLANVCVTRMMIVQNQAPITVGLSDVEAKAARDALAKFIYEKQFDWIVERMNQLIGKGAAVKGKSIGILDIFGFEIFKKNSFEQLCINFTNEKLQQFFNAYTFKKEELLYQFEKIKFDHVHYIDNQPVLDLIEMKPLGILPSIDEELRMPKGSDKTWVDKLLNTHKQNPYFQAERSSADDFVVRHYAGDVIYSSFDFLIKNKDQLNDDAYSLLTTSGFKLLASWFPEQKDTQGLGKKATLGAKFTKQLNDLMITLNATEPHYIRCVKPNSTKSQLTFEGTMSMEQLQYAGVFEAIQIRKQGFPFRLTHFDFVQRYKCIFPQNYKWTQNAVENCKVLIREMKQDFQNVQIGTSRVLYRADQHREMELRRNLAVEDVTVFIQKHMRIKLTKMLEQRCRAIRPVLLQAINSRDMDQLDKALDQASGVGFKVYEHHQAERAKHVFLEEKRLDGVFQVLIQQNPHEFFLQFEEAIKSADEIGMNTNNSNIARQMYGEALAYREAINNDALTQIKVLDENLMKDVLDRADQITYTSEALDQLRTLLYDTAPETFAKLQLKAAVALNDKDRVTRSTIKLKDLVFEKSGDMFKFSKYSKLYTPQAWADLKFIAMNRDELSTGMLRWTKDPIHSSLTQIPDTNKLANKLSKQMFKNILGYMGDKVYPQPDTLAAELLRTCLEVKEIRTEIYCQLIKQVTANPSPQSAQKGWDLLILCMATFPPPSDFENFLEMFLRSFGNPKEKYVNQMHDTLYGGERRVAPTESEFHQILAAAAANSSLFQSGGMNAHSNPEPIAWNPRMGGRNPNAPPRDSSKQGFYPNNGPSPPMGMGRPPVGGPPMGGPPMGGPPMGGPPMGGPPRGGPPRGGPPQSRAPPPEDTSTEWYFVDVNGGQNGPVMARDMKSAWKQGLVNGECIAWNGGLPDWVKIAQLNEFIEYLNY